MRTGLPRNWFPFGRLSALALLVAIGLLAYSFHLRPYQSERHAIRQLASQHRLMVKTSTDGSWLLRRWFGDDHFQRVVHVSVLDGKWNESSHLAVARLTHLQSLLVSGPSFKDEHLIQLAQLESLRSLVLDTTLVTPGGIKQIKQRLPQLWCHRSQRKVIRALRKCMELTTKSSAPDDVQQWLPNDHLQRVVTARVRNRVRNEWLLKLQQLDSLQRLICFRTNIADNQLAYLAHLSNLRFLWLDGASITDGGLSHLRSLVNLEELELQSTRITSRGLQQLEQMHKLRTLNIGRTGVGDEALATLEKMKKLESLRLFGTRITDKGLARLRSLRKLKHLYLEGTRVTTAAIKNLRESLPDITISR